MAEHFLVILLMFGLFSVLILWMVDHHRLINKLMSKNFAEYDLVTKGPRKPVEEVKSRSEYEEELEEMDILNELNGMIK